MTDTPRETILKGRTVPPGDLVVFSVYAHELDNIERGDGSAVIFSIALTLFGTGIGALTTLLAVTPVPIPLTIGYIVITVICVFSFMLWVVLTIIWNRSADRGLAKRALAAIRSRDRVSQAPAQGTALGPAIDDDDEEMSP